MNPLKEEELRRKKDLAAAAAAKARAVDARGADLAQKLQRVLESGYVPGSEYFMDAVATAGAVGLKEQPPLTRPGGFPSTAPAAVLPAPRHAGAAPQARGLTRASAGVQGVWRPMRRSAVPARVASEDDDVIELLSSGDEDDKPEVGWGVRAGARVMLQSLCLLPFWSRSLHSSASWHAYKIKKL